jgi:geranylgeranyl reductase family protein
MFLCPFGTSIIFDTHPFRRDQMNSPVIVAGAGPAGSVCAWKLADSGVDCVILDGCTFPRNKVCGGALGLRVVEALTGCGMLTGTEFDDLILVRHYSMACFWKHEFLRSYSSDGPPISIVDRTRFDNALLEKAASAGAHVITGDRLEEVEKGIIRTRSGSRLDYSVLVGADGAMSTVRRKVFGRLGKRPGIGLQAIVTGRIMATSDDPQLQIHFGLIPYGYGWVFPRKDDCCIGLGAIGGRSTAADVTEAFREFLMRLAGGDQPRIEGAAIPSHALHPSLGRGNVYLAGDAAGLVDQISGEGIGNAVESGLLVAEAILSGDRKEMVRKACSGCVGSVRLSSRYRHLLYSSFCQARAMRGLRSKNKFIREYWNLVSGSVGYNDMMKRFLRDDSDRTGEGWATPS